MLRQLGYAAGRLVYRSKHNALAYTIRNYRYLIKNKRSRAFVYDLGNQYLEALSKDLYTFSQSTIGYPSEYPVSERLVKHADMDEWLDSAPIMAFGLDETVPAGDGLIRMKTVREIGESYVAWREDCLQASTVIKEYLASNDILIMSDYETAHGKVEAAERTKRAEAAFMDVWSWIGKHILDLWD
jgi:hypothetical protein